MVQTIQAKDITLLELETRFKMELAKDEDFFPEWLINLPEITELEKHQLNRVKACYDNLLKYPPLLENSVKMVVLSPLLDLAGFYLAPFHIKSEKSVEITSEDVGEIVKGQIDILVLFAQLVVVVIESKQVAFSVEVGKAQILPYMLALSPQKLPVYGLITNGGSFIFVKLSDTVGGVSGREEGRSHLHNFQYAFSRLFYIFNPGNEWYTVLAMML